MQHSAIILCGGLSTRMGRDKATLPFGSETMLQRVVRLVSEAVPPERVVCVAAPGQSLPPLLATIQVVRDTAPHLGPLAGLATGLAALQGRAQAVFVAGCDLPLLVPAVVARMFERLGDHQIVAPHDGERWHPLVAVYRTDVLPQLESLLATGERSLIALIERCNVRRVSLDEIREVDVELDSLRTCNTPEEYRLVVDHTGGK